MSVDLTTAQGPVTWLERMATDPSLKAFVEAEIARAKIELATAKANEAHWKNLATRLGQQRDSARSESKRKAEK